MTKIVKLRRHPPPRDPESCEALDILVGLRSVQQSARLAASDVESAIEMIQTQLEGIRRQIDAIPDAEVSERLAREHAILTEALQYARTRVASLSCAGPATDAPDVPPSAPLAAAETD